MGTKFKTIYKIVWILNKVYEVLLEKQILKTITEKIKPSEV